MKASASKERPAIVLSWTDSQQREREASARPAKVRTMEGFAVLGGPLSSPLGQQLWLTEPRWATAGPPSNLQ